MAVCWVILRGQQIYTVIQAVHSLIYIVAKCHLFSVVTWKDIIKHLQKCEGCTHFCEIIHELPQLCSSVINYSPSCHSKPVRPFIFGTQIKIFLMNPRAFWRFIDSNATDMFKAQKGSKNIDKNSSCDISGSTVILWSYENAFCHMDYFNDVLTSFLVLEHVSCVAVYEASESSWIHQNIIICVCRKSYGFGVRVSN